MARTIKQGQHIFIAFQDGEAALDSQLRPRIYKSREQFEKSFPAFREGAAELIEYAPTIDAVPVVRCKDCHYIIEYDEYIRDKDEIAHGLWCLLKNHSCEPDGYCSFGYREATT